MTTPTKRNDSLSRNLGRSLLKSTTVNFGLQAIGGNLRKDNIWQTLLVGVAGGFGDYLGGNTAMGAIPKRTRFMIKVMDPMSGRIATLYEDELIRADIFTIRN